MGSRRGSGGEREETEMPRAQQPEPNEVNGENTPPHHPSQTPEDGGATHETITTLFLF